MRLLFFPFPIRLSLRPILVIPFVLEIITILGVTGYISHYNGQRAVNNMSYRLRDEVTDRVTEHLTDYFADANKITETTTNALQNNLLKANDFRTISQFLWNQSKLHDVSYINYGLTTGEYIGSGHCLDRQNAMTITEISPETGFKAYNYLTDNSGNHVGKPEIFKYDFRHEPWFNKVVVSKKPMWTEPYVWDNNPNMISMAIGRPVRDRSGQVIGALSVDLSLTRISDFLRNIKISPTGKVVVIDLQGQLVASSGSEVPFKTSEGGVKRLATGDLPEGITKKASDYLTTKFSNFNTIKQKYHGEFFIDGERYFVQVTPWKDPLGLNLLIMVIVPEKDFMGIIRKMLNLP
ncbi:MAG: hypothetical protein N5P05_000276 [Chroococcopsis gigantea SAG 12.99]|nr:hypothetical protein [Chroococcopsis gigantea SAG 12.99]